MQRLQAAVDLYFMKTLVQLIDNDCFLQFEYCLSFEVVSLSSSSCWSFISKEHHTTQQTFFPLEPQNQIK